MDKVQALRAATDEFASRLAAVSEDELPLPTPCTGWSVADLIEHVLNGSRMAAALARGSSLDEAVSIAGEPVTDLVGECESSLQDQYVALSDPALLSRTVPHPIGEIPGAQLIDFRYGDLTIHAWDLARAIDGEESLNSELVEAVYQSMEPMAEFLPQTGMFGAGRSGEIDDQASTLHKLLDLSGRRP